MSAPHVAMPTLPLALKLDGRLVLVVGGGPVALDKARALVEAGARLRVVAPAIVPELAALAHELHARPFAPADVAGAWLAIAAAPPEVNRAVRAAADARQLFVVAVDDTASASAYGLARLRRGLVTIAIGTEGRAPALAALLRRALDRLIPDELADWATRAEALRAEWKGSAVPLAERRERLRALLLESAPVEEVRS